nr:MAG TPA: hypothetical protein [Caudoviricetes sp.]
MVLSDKSVIFAPYLKTMMSNMIRAGLMSGNT